MASRLRLFITGPISEEDSEGVPLARVSVPNFPPLALEGKYVRRSWRASTLLQRWH